MDLRGFTPFDDGCLMILPIPVLIAELHRIHTYQAMSTRLNQLMTACFAIDDLHDAANPYHVIMDLEHCNGYLIMYFSEQSTAESFSFGIDTIARLTGIIYIAHNPYHREDVDNYYKVYNVCVDPIARGRKIMNKMMDGVYDAIRNLQRPFYLDVYIYNTHALHVIKTYTKYMFLFRGIINKEQSTLEFEYQGVPADYTLYQLLAHVYGKFEKPEDNERIRLLASRIEQFRGVRKRRSKRCGKTRLF